MLYTWFCFPISAYIFILHSFLTILKNLICFIDFLNFFIHLLLIYFHKDEINKLLKKLYEITTNFVLNGSVSKIGVPGRSLNKGQTPKYSGKCRDLDVTEIQKRILDKKNLLQD